MDLKTIRESQLLGETWEYRKGDEDWKPFTLADAYLEDYEYHKKILWCVFANNVASWETPQFHIGYFNPQDKLKDLSIVFSSFSEDECKQWIKNNEVSWIINEMRTYIDGFIEVSPDSFEVLEIKKRAFAAGVNTICQRLIDIIKEQKDMPKSEIKYGSFNEKGDFVLGLSDLKKILNESGIYII